MFIYGQKNSLSFFWAVTGVLLVGIWMGNLSGGAKGAATTSAHLYGWDWLSQHYLCEKFSAIHGDCCALFHVCAVNIIPFLLLYTWVKLILWGTCFSIVLSFDFTLCNHSWLCLGLFSFGMWLSVWFQKHPSQHSVRTTGVKPFCWATSC